MATLLTNPKMNPALAARIEASVGGHVNRDALARLRPRLMALFRLGMLGVVLALLGTVLIARRQAHTEREALRAALLESVRRESVSLGARERSFPERAERWLRTLSGAYEGDLVSPIVAGSGALDEALRRPLVYVRGAIEAFAGSETTREAAAASNKDALLECLVDPPKGRSEAVLLSKVRSGGVETVTPNTRRLYEAFAGLPLLGPEWAAKIETAASYSELTQLEKTFQRAPIERAKQALATDFLLTVMDEPKTSGATELDGESVHAVRVALVDLSNDVVLLRMKRSVDPTWISERRRAEYSRALDSCLLALDLRQALAR